jgi:hypothetical protein
MNIPADHPHDPLTMLKCQIDARCLLQMCSTCSRTVMLLLWRFRAKKQNFEQLPSCLFVSVWVCKSPLVPVTSECAETKVPLFLWYILVNVKFQELVWRCNKVR